jgi:hypothetical protein
MTVVKKKRKKHLRNLKRNKSGRNATVKMTYGSGDVDGKKVYRAYPSITFKGNEKAKPQSYKEALDAGEVYEFKRKKRAERFAAGSWKKGKAKREAMKAYRAKKKSERQAKRNK